MFWIPRDFGPAEKRGCGSMSRYVRFGFPLRQGGGALFRFSWRNGRMVIGLGGIRINDARLGVADPEVDLADAPFHGGRGRPAARKGAAWGLVTGYRRKNPIRLHAPSLGEISFYSVSRITVSYNYYTNLTAQQNATHRYIRRY